MDRADPDDAKGLRRYAHFHVLPGVRRRTSRCADPVGVCHAATNTLRITSRFLTWRCTHRVNRQDIPQAMLDQWSTEYAGSAADVTVFLRWAARNGLTGPLGPTDTRRSGPTAFTPSDLH